jgi:preprotein translocase subunit SecD
MVIAASCLGALVWSLFMNELQAAIRFEVRLAEDKPAPGLREAKVGRSPHSVYLHEEVIVTNSDIAAARVVQVGEPPQYAISIEFNASGAEKMRAATVNHIGSLVAFLFDGKVVMAPLLRTPIGSSAEITGKFTRAEAERIVKRIEIR